MAAHAALALLAAASAVACASDGLAPEAPGTSAPDAGPLGADGGPARGSADAAPGTDAEGAATADGGSRGDGGADGGTSACPALPATPSVEPAVKASALAGHHQPHWAGVDAKGRTLVAGGFAADARSGAFVSRLLPGGALDPTFGTGGTAFLDAPFSAVSRLVVAIDARHRPVVVSNARPAGGGDVLAARLTEAGALDATFGTGGFARNLAGTPSDVNPFAATTVENDTVVYLQSATQSYGAFRLDERGAPRAFGFTIPRNPSEAAGGVRLGESAGGLFVGNRWRVVSVSPAGAVDPTFGTGGALDAAHDHVASLADGSPVTLTGAAVRIFPPGGRGAPVEVTAPLDAVIPLKTAAQRCDGTLLLAAADDRQSPLAGAGVLTPDGKRLPGRRSVTFTQVTPTVAAVDTVRGVVTFFGRDPADASALLAVRAHP